MLVVLYLFTRNTFKKGFAVILTLLCPHIADVFSVKNENSHLIIITPLQLKVTI